jgi:hypothetical protein
VQEELMEDDEETSSVNVSNTTSVHNRLQEVKQAFSQIRHSMHEG